MKHFLALLKRTSMAKKADVKNNINLIQTDHAKWQTLEGIYYLLDTIKLSYPSSIGEVTIEKIPLSQLNEVVQTNLPLIAHGESYTISVCAVSTEQFGAQTRTKAIPNAAHFRARDNRSQALIQDAGLTLDRTCDELTQYEFKRGISRFNNISLGEFIDQLKQANEKAKVMGRHSTCIKSDNFKPLFSDRELFVLKKYGVCS